MEDKVRVIDSRKVLDLVLETLADTKNDQCVSFVKKFKNGYNKVCIIIPCLYHKDKWRLEGNDTYTVTGFTKGKYVVIDPSTSVEFRIFDDFFINVCDESC